MDISTWMDYYHCLDTSDFLFNNQNGRVDLLFIHEILHFFFAPLGSFIKRNFFIIVGHSEDQQNKIGVLNTTLFDQVCL